MATDAHAGERGWVPPISMMAIVGFTHTQADIPAPTDPYHPNDNTVLTPFSGFWGGAITNNIGAFSQVTYNAPGPVSSLSGTPADQFLHTWTWDNTDVRFSNRPFWVKRFRLSTAMVSMSLAGSCFSSESAPRPFQHGIRRRGGTIFRAALPSCRQ
jgi:hypothetical protein